MQWKTAMHTVKGILSGAGVVAGIVAVAKSAALGETLAGYLADATGSGIYQGIQSQTAQAASDAIRAGMVFYDSVRLLLLFGGSAMICFFGLVLADVLKRAPVDVLVDSQGVDTIKRRLARAAAALARRLDPEETTQVVHEQQVLPETPPTIEFATVETAVKEEV